MAIATTEPRSMTAGETVQWRRALPGFSAADGWKLAYFLTGPSKQTITTSADGSDHLATITATESVSWPAGGYLFSARVARGAEAFTIQPAVPTFRVLANPATSAAGSNLSWASQTLAVVEATIQALSARTATSQSINGKTYTLANIGELMKLRGVLRSEIQSEENRLRIASGLKGKNLIRVRFGRS